MRQSGERSKLDGSNALNFIELIKMVEAGEVSSRVAKDLLEEVVFQGAKPKKLAEDRGLLQQSSSESLGAVVEQVLAENPSVVAEYQGGKETALQFLVGQGMKLTKGAANPGILAKLLKEAMQ